MLPVFRLATLVVAFACPLCLAQSLRAQCACGSGASAYGYPSGVVVDPMMFPMDGGMLPPGAIPGPILEGNAIYLTVNVPDDVQPLKINGDETISIGTTRYFVIRHLEADKEYKFTIVAVAPNPAGILLEDSKTVTLKPGSSETVTLKPIKRQKPALVVEKAAEEVPKPGADGAAEAVAKRASPKVTR